MKRIVVNLIPTYNEKENIKKLLGIYKDVVRKNQKYKFITLVADDNSPDGTADIVREFQKKDKSVRLLTGPKLGLGKAMIKSILYAINKLKADIIISNEADFAYDPRKIPYMLSKIE